MSLPQRSPLGINLDGFSGKKSAFVSGAPTPMRLASPFSVEMASDILATASKGTLSDIVVRYDRQRGDATSAKVKITGRVPHCESGTVLHYFAASPAEHRVSHTASGIPFVDAKQAYDSTANWGSLALDEAGGFSVEMPQPNAFYSGLGTRYIPPCVHLWYDDIRDGGKRKHVSVQAGNGIPFRSLRYPDLSTWPRKDATFYAVPRSEPRTQEQILRGSAFPSDTLEMPDNFWGLRPPV